ncbi:MAG: hypothetical protein JWO71_2437 [Candidatus Acidoferrum typicum]|nr:hypothetical protein [Candidatus Acidoferrum typicum]
MAEIISYVQPSRLYRYRSFENLDRELQAIREGYLHCSPYQQLNDPMEGLFASGQLLRKDKKYREIREAITNTKANIGVCSFSEVYDHELMWAHYAGQFKGICVAYSLSRLMKNLGDDLTFVRMFYNEKVPTIDHSRRHPELLAKRVLSTKNYRWLYEREWRMFAAPGRASYTDPSCVTHVYLGSRMDPGSRDIVRRVIQPLGIKLSDMTINKYSISFRSKPQAQAAEHT